ncbi:MAG: hypothetical protein JWR21_2647 [Herminiimonas sp.]|nr:hypothetical protein [Herminiimonas sp.]MDB5855955.1 hypothetical protein [Herminiimonas sp.]
MDVFRWLKNLKPDGGDRTRHTNRVADPVYDPSLPTLTHMPRDVLGLVLHEFRNEPSVAYVRNIRKFSLVSRYCQEAAAAYVKSVAGEYQDAAWTAQEEKMAVIRDAVTVATSSRGKNTSGFDIKVQKKPTMALIKIFSSNPVVRIFLPHDQEFDPVSVGLPTWSRSLQIRCLQFDGLTLACGTGDFSGMARKEVAKKLKFLAGQLPLIETSGDLAQMRFEIFLKGNDASSTASEHDCMLMLSASKPFLDAVATTAVTKLHLEDFWINMLDRRLEELRQLEHLALPGNELSDERALSLVQATKNLPCLALMDLRRNRITPEGVIRLRQYIAENCGHVTLITD